MDRLFTPRCASPSLRSVYLLAIAWLLILPTSAHGESARHIKKQNDALVRTLEALYANSMQTARAGDLDAYWQWRTAASRDRPPHLTKPMLPVFAEMLPALHTLQFVRMDTTAQMARALYKWPREDIARYTVVVYRMEGGDWKIDSISVRTDKVASAQEQQLEQKLRQRDAEYP
jgi:hypothetical protein